MVAVLPNELIGACLAYSQRSVLCVVARTSRALQVEAELHLYQRIVIRTSQSNQMYTTFCRRPQRALCVRTLEVSDPESSSVMLTLLLLKLPCLEDLMLETCNGIEAGASYPFRLRSITVTADCDGLQPTDFARFLQRQDRLTRVILQISVDEDRHDALIARAGAPGMLPQLQTLRGPARLLAALVPGRPVQHVILQRFDTTEDELGAVFDALSQSSKKVLSLDLRTCDGFDVIQRLAVVAPHLESLELMIPQHGLLEFVIQLEENSQPLLQHLKRFRLMFAVSGNWPFWRANLESLTPPFKICFPSMTDYQTSYFPFGP